MGTSFDELDVHLKATDRLLNSFKVNAEDLRRLGGHNDAEAAIAADIVRQNVAVTVCVLDGLLDAFDASLFEKELERAGREPVDPTRAPVQPEAELRRAADRLRERLAEFLREEPSVEAAARQLLDDLR